MTPADACADLAAALPQAAALLTEPDRDGTTLRGKPGSRPPWNSEAANALFDALEGMLRLEASLRYAINGHPGTRRPYSQTDATLRTVASMANGLNDDGRQLVVRVITRWTTSIEQLPALDRAPKWDRMREPCPACQTRWFYAARSSGAVRCAYADCGVSGRLETGRFGPQVLWSDGTVWQAA